MDFVIKSGGVITGDGKSHFQQADVFVTGSRVAALNPSPESRGMVPDGFELIDASGCTTIPGVINAHAHGCIYGPSMPSGSKSFTHGEIEYFRNRHLLQGTTTLLNVCGLAFPDEINGPAGSSHPLDIHVSTGHTGSNIGAALAIDGAGLSARHIHATVDSMLAQGAKALGEVGGGQTLGGGAQEYRFIPEAVERETGHAIDAVSARRLKNAIVGRYLNPRDGVEDDALEEVLGHCGLSGKIQAPRLRQIIIESVMPPVSQALAGFEEIAIQSARVGYPAIYHHAAPTAAILISLAEKYPASRIVAGHSNHPMFMADEAVSAARKLRERGAVIDVSTLDCISTRWRNEPANLDALIAAGLVDTISTDFAGGHWDGILEAVHRIVRKKQLSAPAAVALATGNVANTFPQLAADRGLITKGKRADLVIVDSVNLARVRDVCIAGKWVVRNGGMLL